MSYSTISRLSNFSTVSSESETDSNFELNVDEIIDSVKTPLNVTPEEKNALRLIEGILCENNSYFK